MLKKCNLYYILECKIYNEIKFVRNNKGQTLQKISTPKIN